MLYSKNMIFKGALALLLVVAGNAAQAASPSDPNVGIGIDVSTLGLGAQVGKQFCPYFAARLGFNGYSYSHNFSSNGAQYDGSLNLHSWSVMGDFYPAAKSTFHLTLGLIDNSDKLSATSSPNSDVTYNGVTYTPAETGSVSTTATWPTTDLYAGIGFGKPSESSSRISLFCDFGAMFEGSANVSASHTSTLLNADESAQLNSNIESSVRSSLNGLKVYPVVTLGLAVHI